MQTSEPTSVQQSFAMLYQSSHLGVVIADESRVIDANDAFLRMVGYSRDELLAGEIDWVRMTPSQYRALDENGLEQLRRFGTCVPFEKEYILRDGTPMPFMIGAVRLTEDPLKWAAYIVDLSEQRRAAEAEQKARDLQAKTALFNQLAHELNNPLAALTFILHLLATRPDVGTAETQHLVAEATQMLARVTTTVRQVLDITQSSE